MHPRVSRSNRAARRGGGERRALSPPPPTSVGGSPGAWLPRRESPARGQCRSYWNAKLLRTPAPTVAQQQQQNDEEMRATTLRSAPRQQQRTHHRQRRRVEGAGPRGQQRTQHWQRRRVEGAIVDRSDWDRMLLEHEQALDRIFDHGELFVANIAKARRLQRLAARQLRRQPSRHQSARPQTVRQRPARQQPARQRFAASAEGHGERGAVLRLVPRAAAVPPPAEGPPRPPLRPGYGFVTLQPPRNYVSVAVGQTAAAAEFEARVEEENAQHAEEQDARRSARLGPLLQLFEI